MQEENKKPEKKEENASGEENAVNVDFMKEKIKAHPVNRRKLFRRTVLTVAFAVLFGVIACVVFLVLEPVISSMLNPQSEEAETAVTFPEETSDEMSPEEMIQSDTQIQQQETEEAVNEALSQLDIDKETIKEEIESSIREDLAEDTGSTESIEAQYSTLSEVAASLQTSMVTVTGTRSDTDWAGDAYEDSGKTSGVLIAETDEAYLVLADTGEMDDAEEITVTFSDVTSASAVLSARDTVTGLGILEVEKKDIGEDTLSTITTAELGSSARADLLGKPIIAVGSPSGTQGSVSYGAVTNASVALDVADSVLTGIQTDIYGSTQAGGILSDLEGRMIGWTTMEYNRKDAANLVSAIGITELKPLIEALSNGEGLAGIGVHGTDVPENIQEEYDVPAGCYVTRVEMDSPAMEAGLQAGDVIQTFDTTEVTGMEDFTKALENAVPGQTVQLVIMRQGVDGYESVTLSVTPENRIVTSQ